MADLMDLLQGQLSGAVLKSLTSNLGAKNQQQTQNATNDAISILVNAMAKNSSSSKGASALGAALDRDHDGSVLDDIMGMMAGNKTAPSRALNGAGILGHILGGRQNGAIDMLTKRSGMNKTQTLSLLIKLAPMIMGVLGKMKKSNNMDTTGLPDILSGAASKVNRQTSGGNILGSLFDQDGDGNFNNEIKKVGFSFLKSLFRR
ncbi:MAG: DUF937 domain-containing protein [Saprospiraceae bacterium]